jgi:hypothetical protein
MWVLGGDCSKIIRDGEPFFGLDGTHYPPQWDKADVPGMQQIDLTPEPVVPGFRTVGHTIKMVDGVPTRVWQQEPIPDYPSAEQLAAEAEAHKEYRIAALEAELAALRGSV